MSLYNTLFGVNQLAPILLKILGIDQVRMPDAPDILTTEYDGKKVFDYYEAVYESGSTDAENAWHEFKEKLLQVKFYPSGRFRDIHLNETGDKITMHTRNGGGNRDAYQYVFDLLRRHPNYLSDKDDDFDCTYANIKFSVPAEYQELCKAMATGEKIETIGDKFQRVIESLKS